MSEHIMIIAGEASGDQHGATLVRECNNLRSDLSFTGIGGEKMRAAGVKTFADVSELAVVGFIEVIAHLPTIYKTFNKVKHALQTNPPALLILVDYPGFNLRLAKVAKKLGIKVLYYISPQVWAWRQGRVKTIAKIVDHMAVVFPFEVKFYQQANVPVTYVGHPLTHEVRASIDKTTAQKEFGLNPNKKMVALLPGSRQSELSRLLPTMLATAELLAQKHVDLQFILLQASTISDAYLDSFLAQSTVKLHIVKNRSYDVMLAADALMIASGTATLEAALMATPMVVIYKIAPLTALLAKHLIKIDNIALCNIVAEKRIVPELLQDQANPEQITHEIEKLLYDNNYRLSVISELEKIREKMGTEDGSKNVAKLALNLLD